MLDRETLEAMLEDGKRLQAQNLAAYHQVTGQVALLEQQIAMLDAAEAQQDATAQEAAEAQQDA